MSKETAVIVLGILVIVIPQLGIPSPWKTTFLVLAGLALIAIGFYLRAEIGRGRSHDTGFVENTPHDKDDAHDRKEGINSLN